MDRNNVYSFTKRGPRSRPAAKATSSVERDSDFDDGPALAKTIAMLRVLDKMRPAIVDVIGRLVQSQYYETLAKQKGGA